MKCALDKEEGIPDKRRCPKKMLNGPCGGQLKGKCEVNPGLGCVWVQVYEELKKRGKEKILKELCMR
ncbi:MAG: methylenetetrahydrofolate reductase C-terminal domain-containing protein [Candidatus Altiarchaeota archaeon]|nr:methylenetetrahydrofolate reductase C-terminal domain-containing protein [Candidatus Altiarchaeota archaeon]